MHMNVRIEIPISTTFITVIEQYWHFCWNQQRANIGRGVMFDERRFTENRQASKEEEEKNQPTNQQTNKET